MGLPVKAESRQGCSQIRFADMARALYASLRSKLPTSHQPDLQAVEHSDSPILDIEGIVHRLEDTDEMIRLIRKQREVSSRTNYGLYYFDQEKRDYPTCLVQIIQQLDILDRKKQLGIPEWIAERREKPIVVINFSPTGNDQLERAISDNQFDYPVVVEFVDSNEEKTFDNTRLRNARHVIVINPEREQYFEQGYWLLGRIKSVRNTGYLEGCSVAVFSHHSEYIRLLSKTGLSGHTLVSYNYFGEVVEDEKFDPKKAEKTLASFRQVVASMGNLQYQQWVLPPQSGKTTLINEIRYDTEFHRLGLDIVNPYEYSVNLPMKNRLSHLQGHLVVVDNAGDFPGLSEKLATDFPNIKFIFVSHK